MTTVFDLVRDRSSINSHARVVSENNFESNIGLGASASAFAALALAASDAAGLNLPRMELSRLARRGSTSAARSVTGIFSHLHTSEHAEDCVAERISDVCEENIRIIVGVVPEYKRTSRVHTDTTVTSLSRPACAHPQRIGQDSRCNSERRFRIDRRFGNWDGKPTFSGKLYFFSSLNLM